MSTTIMTCLSAIAVLAITASPLSAQLTVGRSAIEIEQTYDLQHVWNDKGSGAQKDCAFWRPVKKGYFPVGDIVVGDYDDANETNAALMVKDGPGTTKPDDYKLVWNSQGSDVSKPGSIWQPIPPKGFVAMGCVANQGLEKPSTNIVRCVREDLVSRAALSNKTWSDLGSNADIDVSTYTVLDSLRGQRSPGVAVAHAGVEQPKAHPCAYVFSDNSNSTEVSVGEGMIAIKVFDVVSDSNPEDRKTYCELHKVANAFKIKYGINFRQMPPPDVAEFNQLRKDIADALDGVQGGRKVTSTLNTLGTKEKSDGFTTHWTAVIFINGSVEESEGTRFLKIRDGVVSSLTLASPVEFQSYELGVCPTNLR